MDDHTEFSFEVRLVIARLDRLVSKFDGTRTSLSDEGNVMRLVTHALNHTRPEVQSIVDELLYLMTAEELALLSDRGVMLPNAYAALLPEAKRGAVSGRPRRVYRRQVTEE